MPIPFILGEVRVFEFFLYISFIFYFPKVFRKKVKLIKLDKLVYFYFILSLISTLVDLANIYDGLQSFRWTVLPPVIFYIIIRSEFKNISYYTKYITIMLPGILLYAILFIKDKALSDFTRSYVDEHGTIRLISLAYCFALGTFNITISYKNKYNKNIDCYFINYCIITYPYTRNYYWYFNNVFSLIIY